MKESKTEASDRRLRKDWENSSRFDELESEIRSIQTQYQAVLQGIAHQSDQLAESSKDEPLLREIAALRTKVNLMWCLPDAAPQEVIPKMQKNIDPGVSATRIIVGLGLWKGRIRSGMSYWDIRWLETEPQAHQSKWMVSLDLFGIHLCAHAEEYQNLTR